jgi:hypothetical protein
MSKNPGGKKIYRANKLSYLNLSLVKIGNNVMKHKNRIKGDVFIWMVP